MNRIKELRKEKKVSQKEIADFLGISEKTISRWENSENTIKSDKAKELAKYFNVSVAYLLGYSDTTKDNKDFITISVKEYNELKKQSDVLDGVIETLKDKRSTSYKIKS
ncbi:helix-turn-helix domain-containing protein [Streptococcus pyogenes]|uniref:helix-turn-helix domain-containing protein n=1 Tax=Streptococcus pyogenes TaxID=1314 RepID=UPI00052A8D11|nr:helix-turn-helix transcriptional regulator [Streptococcus pyogenes]QBX29057.1 XRE family transcriptional regulator [Streptococcus phage Javan478]AIW11663.1 Cro/Cl family transcriptional regulator [Streptococcus pyogenes]VGR57044.1 Transcriptional regulator, Cro/CI family [Streptococcus pyogenes]VGR61016.1 Transcriptional regulator, Cro/CI family [Streptococcus pyogenes]VGT90773.1 Transcriptional regulator, Cro/CI family [Streptococcus pyogenes]